MNDMRNVVKRLMPKSLYDALGNFYWNTCKGLLSYRHPERRSNAALMRQFKHRHKNERCFILGNGPSLNKTDLSLLKDEFTFGLNRIYLLFPQLNFTTTYLVSTNPHVIEQFADDIAALPMPKFVAWEGRKFLPQRPDTIFFHKHPRDLKFSKNPAFGVWEGATVTYVAMQLAYYMGFQKVILIGVDHSFKTQGPAHKLVVSENDDPNHFSGSYFGRGVRWQLPDLDTSEIAYTLAKEAYRRAGREIVDATIEGKLEVFPKVDYASLF